ncbi:LysR family transcriptional regulator [Gorillibacterium massiliense]|uniref:LysR family transcriptional regulator n=1 Tax=Gorillibacterium massiliense TaxID=1280390 RepID=UPI0004B68345|nr:LysR family transcriptional regulator [Gorillibacterium massiliense]
MDIRQIRYFLTIAQEGQITRAAKVLNMEQPPLSRQLKLMEEELGVTLFDRSGNRLNLTHAGELMQQKAEALLLQLHESIQEVKELDKGIRGSLSIGSVVSCISLLPERIRLFREHYPLVTFIIREGDHFLLDEMLDKRNIELIVARLPFEAATVSKSYGIMPLPSDPFVAIVPSQWNLSPMQDTILMRELMDYPFLTLKSDKTTGMHEKVMRECRRHGFEPQVISECSSVAIIIALVAAGIGATVLPKSVMASFPLASIRVLALSDVELQSDVGIVWLKDRYLSKAARQFIADFAEITPFSS